jgi:hypothetical protein
MSTPVQNAAPGSVANSASVFSELVANPTLGARRMSVAPGTVLYEPHTPASNLYVINRGQIRT